MKKPIMFRQQSPKASAQMKLAERLMENGSSSAPVRHPLEGIGRLAQALGGAYIQRETAKKDTADRNAANALLLKGLTAKQWDIPEGEIVLSADGYELEPGEAERNAAPAGGLAGAAYALGQMKDNYYAQQKAPELAMQDAMRKQDRYDKEVDRHNANVDKRSLMDHAASLRPEPKPVPGRDVPYPPEVATQRIDMAEASRPQTTVKLPEQQKEFDKVMGKEYAQTLIDTQKAAQSSRKRASSMQVINKLLAGVRTGAGGQTALQIKKAADAAGIQLDLPENIGAAEAAQALSNQMALELRNPAGGAGMPGAMSDADRVFLSSMTPGLSQTAQGRRMMEEVAQRTAKRDATVAKMARDYARRNGNRLDAGFYDELAEYSASNPMFGDLETISGPNSEGPAVGTVEENHRFLGGDPSNPASWEKVR